MFNELQPGVFALSGWDLCGLLTLDAPSVRHLIADGDTRWINRGADDLMDVVPDAAFSTSGMPRGRSLYGSLASQLGQPNSFARVADMVTSEEIATVDELLNFPVTLGPYQGVALVIDVDTDREDDARPTAMTG